MGETEEGRFGDGDILEDFDEDFDYFLDTRTSGFQQGKRILELFWTFFEDFR